METPETEKHTQFLNIPVTLTQKAMLAQIAQKTDNSMAHVVRMAIQNQHGMTFANEPKCANGTACACPHMHSVQVHTNTTNHDRVMAANQQLEKRSS